MKINAKGMLFLTCLMYSGENTVCTCNNYTHVINTHHNLGRCWCLKHCTLFSLSLSPSISQSFSLSLTLSHTLSPFPPSLFSLNFVIGMLVQKYPGENTECLYMQGNSIDHWTVHTPSLKMHSENVLFVNTSGTERVVKVTNTEVNQRNNITEN